VFNIEVTHNGKRVLIMYLMLDNVKGEFEAAKKLYGSRKIVVRIKNSTRTYIVPFNELTWEPPDEKSNRVFVD